MEVIRPLTIEELLFPTIQKVNVTPSSPISLPLKSTYVDIASSIDEPINFASSLHQKPDIQIVAANFLKKNKIPFIIGGILLGAAILITIDYLNKKKKENN